MPFEEYSQYYDSLYEDKDYRSEVDYVDGLIRSVAPDAFDLLDLGCGTGAHARYFARQGYRVVGVDLSEEQIRIARTNNNGLVTGSHQPVYYEGDIRRIRLKKKFDAVVSLFHVISYQTANKDLIAAFQTAREHLKNSGVFIFDVWYGPAVLNLRPETRVKRVTTESADLTRIAEPAIHTNRNLVEVQYELMIQDKSNDKVKQVREIHQMRYLFLPEIEHYLQTSGFQLIRAEQWLNGDSVGEDTWNCCILAAPEVTCRSNTNYGQSR